MKRLPGGIALLFIAACGPGPAPAPPPPAAAAKADDAPKKKARVDKKGRSKSPELYAKYMEIMEQNGDLLDSITEDIEKKKEDAAIKPKVAKLVKNAEAARALHYRKNPDEDRELDDDFELFLFKMKDLVKATWDAESGKELLEKVSGRCTICHDKFQ